MTDPIDEAMARMRIRNKQDFIIYFVEPAVLVLLVVIGSLLGAYL